LRASTTVVFCAIDDLIPSSGRPLTGFPDFLDALGEAKIPCVWATSRNRHELDSSLRRLAHAEPFIAEGGSAVYIPEDYFHLKPARTVRLGRFISIPVAAAQPAAQEGLELLAEETGVTVVPLRSLSPRELAQNTGLARDAAESLRQRDFDELFFFAGASEHDIQRFRARAAHHKFSVRQRGSLWSLAVHASLASCILELRKLYDRALHAHALSIGIATAFEAQELFPSCDRGILLTERSAPEASQASNRHPAPKPFALFSAGTWPNVLEAIRTQQFS
jgi:mannosyl-3-phosphoglycerate phosphatase